MSDRTEVLAGHLAPNPTAAAADKLVGRCSCGSVSWEGRGDPAGQFFDLRDASSPRARA